MEKMKISNMAKLKTGVKKTSIDSELIKMHVNSLADVTPKKCHVVRKADISPQIVVESKDDLENFINMKKE